ncbi:TPA: restriction endonuclease subunit S [Klebsiella pneumoniae]|uniref:restriction endonuclease subunit S n=1 Tax=Salmonella enterica TaxID=28901 RepID=UPI00352728FF
MKGLPLGWIETTIGEISTLVNGRAFKPGEWEKEGLPIIRIQNLNRADAQFNFFSGPVSKQHLVNNGDLLFAWSGTPGTSFGAHIWRGATAILNQHIFNVRVDSRAIDREYLRLAINQTIDEQIAKAHGGAGLRHVTKKAFESTKINLPPLKEQKRIAQLVLAFEERNALIRSQLETVISSVSTGHAAFLQAAYDLSLVSAGKQELNSDKTLYVTVGEIALSITYGTSAKSSAIGEVPVLRMGNIQQGEIDWTNLVYTSDKQEINRYMLEDGDVLFNRTNSPQLVGKTAIFRGEQPAVYAGYLIRVKCSEKMLPEYLTYCLNSPAGRKYCHLVKSDGVSQSNINSKKLAAFRIPCPDISVQREIVNRISSGLKKLVTVEIQAKNALKNLDVLHKTIVRQALMGKFNTHNSLDEPASVQLKQLTEAKKSIQNERSEKKRSSGGKIVRRKVLDILREADDWVSAQTVAEQYGLTFGTQTEDVEPFFSELRKLDAEGELIVESVLDTAGAKVSQRLRLKDKS